ncbi:hypothetical protein JCM24511_01596 [Saitozyma sp. JCM 24511]|nr:hypothetical protein JCM24511_01596 [Saitozyma sp. JCM 24511]
MPAKPAKPASSSSSDSDSNINAKRSSLDTGTDLEDHQSSPSPKKTKKTSPKKSGTAKGTQVHSAWTTEEDAIFLEVVGSLLKSGIWPAVKEDGRLTHRGGTGVKAHCTALMNKLKKA